MSQQGKRVVIVGGGYGGTAVAKALDQKFEVTLIEKRERFFHNPGALRAAVDAQWLQRLFIPYNHLLNRGQILRSTVVQATAQEVVLEDGQRLGFDYLVLATGSTYPFPAKMVSDRVSEAQSAVQRVNKRVQQAQHILLIGAGPVGIELAGEIASRYPGKPITLIDIVDTLLPNFNPKLGERLYKGLKQLGVHVLLGERLLTMPKGTNALDAEKPSMQTYFTDKGTSIEADLYFVCFGLQLNTQYLQSSLAGIVDEHGQVKVNEYLQVMGYHHLFAVGDLVNVGETKLASNAGRHANIVAANIRRLAENRQELKIYKPMKSSVMVVPLGENGGAAQLPVGRNGLVLGAWAASRIKGKRLLAERYWNALGASLDAPLPETGQ